MTTGEAISIIWGFVTPFLVTALKKKEWSFSRKVAIVWLIAIFFGLLSVVAENKLENTEISLASILKNIAIVIGVSQTFYGMLYEKVFEKGVQENGDN